MNCPWPLPCYVVPSRFRNCPSMSNSRADWCPASTQLVDNATTRTRGAWYCLILFPSERCCVCMEGLTMPVHLPENCLPIQRFRPPRIQFASCLMPVGFVLDLIAFVTNQCLSVVVFFVDASFVALLCYLDVLLPTFAKCCKIEHWGIDGCLLSLCKQLTQQLALACLKMPSLRPMSGNCPPSTVVFLLGEACRFPSSLEFASRRFILDLDTGCVRTIPSSYRLGGLSEFLSKGSWSIGPVDFPIIS